MEFIVEKAIRFRRPLIGFLTLTRTPFRKRPLVFSGQDNQ
jgi:hypothetical protein